MPTLNITPWMVEIFVETALILLVALLLSAWLHRASASRRHHIWSAAVLAVLALPLLSALLPSWQLDLPNGVSNWLSPEPKEGSAIEARIGPGPEAMTPGDAHLGHGQTERGGAELAQGFTPSSNAETLGAPNPVDGESMQAAGAPNRAAAWAGFLAKIWLAGCAFFLLRLALSSMAAWWMVRRSTPIEDPAWLKAAEDARQSLGISTKVALVESPRLTMPMAWGLLRSTVLLPREARAWTADRRRVVLLHEMAHHARKDCLILFLARLVQSFHWFDPLAWLASSRIRSEREKACDDLVLSCGAEGPDYAQHLLDLARSGRPSPTHSWATVAMARPSELEGRLLSILDPERDRETTARPLSMLGVGLGVMLVFSLASLEAAPSGADGPWEEDGQATGTNSSASSSASSEASSQGSGASGGSASAAGASGLASEGSGRSRERSDDADPRVVQIMIEALLDPEAEVRVQAAHSLGMMEAASALPALDKAVRDDEEAAVREQAAWALGMIESDAAVDSLSLALRDASPAVRDKAAWALGMIESDAAVDPLVDALDAAASDMRGSEDMRVHVAWALGMIESPRAVGALSVVLQNDPSSEVRKQAAWGLGMIEDRQGLQALLAAASGDASAGVREQAVWGLGMVGDEAALDVLLNAMKDEDRDVARRALWAIGQISS